MDRSVLVCGLGRVGSRIVEQLVAADVRVTVISLKEPETPLPAGVTFHVGDCRRAELLQTAGLDRVNGVIVVTSDDTINVQTALLVRRLNADVRIVVRMFNQNLLPRLGNVVKNTVALSVSALTAPLIVLTALTGDARGAFKLFETTQQIAEVLVGDDPKLAGRRITDVANRHKVLVLAHTPAGGHPQLWDSISADTVLKAGDALVVSGSSADLAPLLGATEGTGDDVRWAGWLRRQLRSVRRAVVGVDAAVRWAGLSLFLVLFISSVVFRFGVGVSWAEGVYQTVSVIATGGELKGEQRPEWVKVFLSGLKLAGAALLAAFTAILTQYLIRIKLGGVLEARRIPDGGHIVVCGLGNVGFRCVEELVRLGHPVVAVDKVNDNPFAETVRRLGAAMVIGDATVATVLDQARVGTARAVIAATEAELSNLEIALLVRDVNPNQRVVVRLTDPTFAATVRDAANIRLAVSVPALAAPAFAAALFGDRVQTLVTVGGRTLAVLELTIQDNDPCLKDVSLTAAMIDYRFLPLGVAGMPPFAVSGWPKALRLRAGQSLTVATDVPGVERLFRREPAVRNQAVTVTAYPLSARDVLVPILRTNRGCSQAEAETAIGATPFVLAEKLTAGEAGDLVLQLAREKVSATVA